jgi:hypothetical protein
LAAAEPEAVNPFFYQFLLVSSGPLSPERDDLLPVGDEDDESLGQLVRGRRSIKYKHHQKFRSSRVTRGRCYDHDFRRFSSIFGDFRQISANKLAFFSETNAMIIIFIVYFCFEPKTPIFSPKNWRKYFYNHDIALCFGAFSPIGRLFSLGRLKQLQK